MPTYKITAKKLGKECSFEAIAPERQEVIKKAAEHAKVCSICAGITEEQATAAVEEIQ
jgi:predicted small metal-binding protein